MHFQRTSKITTVTFSIGQSNKIQSKSMRANLQIGSKENMFVNVLEIFNNVFVQIS
jgi:Zn finger protein HypA/HybF involved in hydrogenase expression